MKIKRLHKSSGFTLIELIIAVVAAAMLMTAVAVAFDASVKNYSENEKIYKSLNQIRQALQRITSRIRTANSIALPGDEASNFCSMMTGDGKNYTYEFRSADKALYLIDNDSSTEYLLCDDVTNMSFTKATGLLNEVTVVKNVRISMEVTIGGQSRVLNTAAVVRRCIQ